MCSLECKEKTTGKKRTSETVREKRERKRKTQREKERKRYRHTDRERRE